MTSSDTSVVGEEEWNAEEEGGSSSLAVTPSKKRKQGKLKVKCTARKIVIQDPEFHSTRNDIVIVFGYS